MCGTNLIYVDSTNWKRGFWKFKDLCEWRPGQVNPNHRPQRKTALQHYAELTKIKVKRNG